MDDPRQTTRNIDSLLAKVKEIEELLSLPAGVPGRTDQICALARAIGYNAPHGGIADLARKVTSEAREPDSRRIGTYLTHLKAEIEEAKKRCADDSSGRRNV